MLGELICRNANFATIVLVLFIFAVIGCTRPSTPNAPPAPTAAPATQPAAEAVAGLAPENFFPRLKRAITREGFVFHTSSELIVWGYGDTISTLPLWTAEAWLNAARGQGRIEFRKNPASTTELPDRVTGIFLDKVAYYKVTYGSADGDKAEEVKLRTCPLSDAPSLVFAFTCEPFPEVAKGKADGKAEYEGRPAVALIYEERRESAAGTPGRTNGSKVTTSFYLDRSTFLPLVWITESRDDAGSLLAKAVASYVNDFVPLESLPASFFDPASIGYVKKDPVDPVAPLDDLNLGITVYWLGREFAPLGDLPPLMLWRAYGLTGHGGGPGNRAMIEYRSAEPGTAVLLQLWQLQEWQGFLQTPLGRLWWDSPCVQTKEIRVGKGRATIFLGYEPAITPPAAPVAIPSGGERPLANTPQPREPLPKLEAPCLQGPFDRFLAHVYLGDTVVAVNAPFCLACAARGYQPDPYDTLEGIEAVVKALRPRAVGD